MENFLTKFRPKVFEDVCGHENAVRKLKNIIIQGNIPAGIFLSGDFGVGKTSLAKLSARSLLCEQRPPKTFNPCGECDSCKQFPHNGQYIERDCSKLTPEQLRSDLTSYMVFRVIYFDEFQRLKFLAQDMFLKPLEGDPYHMNILFIFSTAEPGKVDPALIKRVLHLELSPPTVEQITSWLEKICGLAPIRIEDKSALGLIAECCKCIPRDCLNFLYDHCILEGQPISKQILKTTIRIDGIGRERITSRTKF
jgi:DNA polymerase III subunit gamma/tau